ALGPDQPLRRGMLLERRARSHWAADNATEGMEAIEKAAAAVEHEPPSAEQARVLAAHGQMLLLVGRAPESRDRCAQAIAAARQGGARQVEGYALTTLGTARAALEGVDEGAADLRGAIRIAREEGHPEDLCRAYFNLAIVFQQSGR